MVANSEENSVLKQKGAIQWYRDPKYLVPIGIVVVVAAIYVQSFGFDFINLDDDQYITNNSAIRGGISFAFVKWAFTAFYAANWHPLTWLSHALDVTFFGVAAGGAHAMNVIFHAVNSILLFYLIRLVTGRFWESAAVAAIFAVHPTHVESVAWIAERKDVLSTLFWLLSTLFYVKYVRDTPNHKLYIVSLVLFAVGLAAKPMLVTLPFTLLLLDYWPLERIENFNAKNIWPLVREKLPFFGFAAASSVVTIFAQQAGGAIQSTTIIPITARLANAVVAYAKYTAMMFYPADLGVWYPFEADISPAIIAISGVAIITISGVCIWQIRVRKYLFVGWFFFLGTLVPVIGILQVGRQALADRYTYVPYIGLSIAVVWLASDLLKRFKLPVQAIASVGGVVVLAFSTVAFKQVSYWKNAETIAQRTLAVTRNNYLIESNYCNYLERLNRLDEAATQCRSAIEHDPTLVEAWNNLGTVQMKQNKWDDARASFEKTIELAPEYSLAYGNLAEVETNAQNVAKALEYLNKAIVVDKDGFFDAKRRAEAYSNIAVTAMKLQKYDVAADAYKDAIEASPQDTDLARNLASAYRASGRANEAVPILLDVIKRNPNSAEAYNTLGIIYAEQNRKQDAIAQFQRALQINPNFAQAKANLQRALE